MCSPQRLVASSFPAFMAVLSLPWLLVSREQVRENERGRQSRPQYHPLALRPFLPTHELLSHASRSCLSLALSRSFHCTHTCSLSRSHPRVGARVRAQSWSRCVSSSRVAASGVKVSLPFSFHTRVSVIRSPHTHSPSHPLPNQLIRSSNTLTHTPPGRREWRERSVCRRQQQQELHRHHHHQHRRQHHHQRTWQP